MAVLRRELIGDELELIGGGATGIYQGVPIVTVVTKACVNFEKLPTLYSKPTGAAVKGTCGACKHMGKKDGWNICLSSQS